METTNQKRKRKSKAEQEIEFLKLQQTDPEAAAALEKNREQSRIWYAKNREKALAGSRARSRAITATKGEALERRRKQKREYKAKKRALLEELKTSDPKAAEAITEKKRAQERNLYYKHRDKRRATSVIYCRRITHDPTEKGKLEKRQERNRRTRKRLKTEFEDLKKEDPDTAAVLKAIKDMNNHAADKKSTQKNWAKKMVKSAKHADQKANRTYDATDGSYIDVDFLKSQLEQQQALCIYCHEAMIYGIGVDRRSPSGLTVQRIDNNIAHLKTNCVLACFQCNVRHIFIPHVVALQYWKEIREKTKRFCRSPFHQTDILLESNLFTKGQSSCNLCRAKETTENLSVITKHARTQTMFMKITPENKE